MLEALKALSVFFTDNSLRTRRNLRGDIERRSLSINEDFARIFKDVKEVPDQWLLYLFHVGWEILTWRGGYVGSSLNKNNYVFKRQHMLTLVFCFQISSNGYNYHSWASDVKQQIKFEKFSIFSGSDLEFEVQGDV